MKTVRFLSLLLLLSGICFAQTTYHLDHAPFVCAAATSRGDVQLSFNMFNCRGIFYNAGDLELFFNGGSSSVEVSSVSGKWTAFGSLSLTNFTQPNPFSCPVQQPGYVTGCPDGTVPGTFTFNWTAVDGANNVHTGKVNGTWEDIQYCGGTRCWYHPVLETADLTLN